MNAPPPLPPGRIKMRPEDFVVEEIPAYAPSGAGEHVMVRFTKRDRTTIEAVRVLAAALGCDPRQAGVAGMKDRRAVTTQTISLQAPRGATGAAVAERARSLSLDGVRVLDAAPHGHKLKAGHLAGNRFAITVRDVPVDRLDDVGASFEAIARRGVPNAFGAQRFGFAGDNAERAVAWLRGDERGPRDRRMQRFLFSSLQSAIFNEVLAARVEGGTWATAIEGDVMKLHATGGLFVCSNVQTDRERAAAGEISATGPVFGVRMRSAEGEALALERRIVDRWIDSRVDLSRTRSLGEGTRRALRVWVKDLEWSFSSHEKVEKDDEERKRVACMRVDFVLPKGAYATTVLGAALTIHESRGETGGDDEESPSEFTD